MENNEIYIDGVNVAGCEFAVKPKNDNRIKCHCAKGLLQIAKMQEQPESIKSGLCENNPDCYYKQLKRLEQENNSLQAQLNNITVQSNNEITALEQENKELKEMYRLSCLKCEYKNTKADVDNYRSALEEIRTYLDTLSSVDSDFTNTETYLRIQDKINEVLNS